MPTKQPDERRRSESSRRAVLDAAWALFGERGLRALTVDAIAVRAGVSKATIYRWWPSKATIVMDALEVHLAAQIPFPHTGSAVSDLREQLRSVITVFATTAGDAYLSLVVESRHDPVLAAALTEHYIDARRADAEAVLRRGMASGELRADLDTGTAVDVLYGALYYRLLVSHAVTGPDYADTLVAQLAGALRVPTTPIEES